MSTEATQDQSFRIERHGEVAVVIPSAKVEEMHEALIEQAAKMVISSLKQDPPSGIVVDLSQVNYVGSIFVSFLLRCHTLAKKQGSEIVLAGVSAGPGAAAPVRAGNAVGLLPQPQGSHRGPQRH